MSGQMIEFIRVKMIKNSKITRIKLEKKGNARERVIIFECFASGNQIKTRRCRRKNRETNRTDVKADAAGC